MLHELIIDFIAQFFFGGLGYITLRYVFQQKDIELDDPNLSLIGFFALIFIVLLIIGLIRLIHFFY